MRIAISCHPTTGGSGIVATELAMALSRRGHDIHMVSYARPLRLEEDSGVAFHQVNVVDYPLFKYPPHDLCLANKLAEVVKNHDIDVIHAHYAVPHAISAIMARDITVKKPRVAATLHGTDITLVGNQEEFYDLVRHTMNRCDGLTAVSEWLKGQTMEIFRPEVEPVVIPNFVDGARFHAEARNGFASAGALEVIHASNFRPVKRIFDVVRVFNEIRKKVPARLLLVGEGPELGLARELVGELGIRDITLFTGSCAHMGEVLRCGHLFALLSEYESFGLSVLEAMACGVPILASDAGGLKEVVEHGKTGFLCKVGDIAAAAENALGVLSDRSKWEAMSRAAAERAHGIFGLDRVVKQYEDFYAGL
jgi:N-acetyl-alpha-D-glucosaminyl L-malate synthase BshA